MLSPLQQTAMALSGSNWNAGHIIDNAVFTDSNTMDVPQIQSFLNAKVGACDNSGSQNAAPYNSGMTRAQYDATVGENTSFTCINQYVENPTSHLNNLDGNAIPSGGESAAQIIYNAAQEYDINPQVLIVTIQKEQGLVTDTWPWDSEYKLATGYACPDSASVCNSSFYGFYNQVNSAAWQFHQYMINPNNFDYTVGNNNILYSPTSSCGSSTVDIVNQATAALYDYTPYQPDPAALANVSSTNEGGSGDACSSYGNRNFWWYFNNWFGSPYFTVNINYPGSEDSVDNMGGIAVVPVVLSSPPSSTIQLNYGVSNSGLAKIVGNSSLAFTPGNWNIPQDITVEGLTGTETSQNFNLQVLYINSPDGTYSQGITPFLTQYPMFWSNTSEAAVYRLYDSTTGQHAYAVSSYTLSSLESSGYALETTLGYQCRGSSNSALDVDNSLALVRPVGSSDIPDPNAITPTILYSNTGGDIPVTILKNSGGTDTILSSSSAEVNSLEQGGYTYVTTVDLCDQGDVPVYRLYDTANNSHFYTDSTPEADSILGAGFGFEGVAWYDGPANSIPVYRLYDPLSQTHFYTASPAESAASQQLGYSYEGVAWYAGSSSTPVYRLYDPVADAHFYTASPAESTSVQGIGFKYEGVAWYAK
jgi:hypothetical protein